jgi:hypothetical protein
MAYVIAFFFFLIISGVVIFGIWGIYKLGSYALKIVRYFQNMSDETYQERLQKRNKLQRFILKYPTQSIVAFVLTLNILLVIDKVYVYFNENMRYPEAKALYVVGNVANVYSKTLSLYLDAPDKWYVYPLHAPFLWIKQGIFALGISYLPEKEAERELWRYDWFYHPYVVKFHQHRGLFQQHEKRYQFLRANETFRVMLEDLWKMMNTMNAHSFADKNRYYDFLMVMPTIGTYYFLYNVRLLPEDEFEKRNIYGSTNPLITKRNAHLQEMMEEVYRNWNDPVFIKERLYKAPQVEATYQALMLMLMEQRISDLIYARTFSCTHPMIREYTELRQEFFSSQNGIWIFLKKQGKQAKVKEFIDGAKDNIAAEYARQLLWEYCGIDLPGVSKYYPPVEGDEGWHYGLATKRRLFANEIRILENELNITRINASKPTITQEDINNSRSTK